MTRAEEILNKTDQKSEPVDEKDKNWSYAVTHRKPGTFPPGGTFTKSGEEIAKIMARKSVSPNGLGSAIQMVQFFINRAGKSLKPDRKDELQKAIKILQDMKNKE